jgi:hypothetical protein
MVESKSAPSQDVCVSSQTGAAQSRNLIVEDESLPMYYDSEPSSQSPKHLNVRDLPTSTSQSPHATTFQANTATSTPKPPSTHRNSAPAATVAAILASPYEDLDDQRREHRTSKTICERWRDFKDRNFHDRGDEVGGAGVGSAAEWNVMGGKLSGGQPSPYRKKNRK